MYDADPFKTSINVVVDGDIFIYCRKIFCGSGIIRAIWLVQGNSVIDNRNFPVEHAGSPTCGEENCHKNIYKIWIENRHKTVQTRYGQHPEIVGQHKCWSIAVDRRIVVEHLVVVDRSLS